uniref:Mediator of RNA polymerase II transcription subunit 28 n=1 Tax=Anopheles melas TaxID=34690 RepID=A0A182TVM2_9DIPT
MASSSNVGSGNLVDELEEAFQSCIHALTKEESATGIDKDEIKVEVDQTTLKFIDLARQMEAFFLQKRFLLSALKPDLLLKEENFDLKQEIGRKDELIRKHYEKIESWKQLLSDQQNFNKPIQSMPPDMRGNLAGGAPGGGPAGMMASGGMNLPMQWAWETVEGDAGGAGDAVEVEAVEEAVDEHEKNMEQAKIIKESEMIETCLIYFGAAVISG